MPSETDDTAPWGSDMTWDFNLTDVRIVGTFGSDGGAIVEEVPWLTLSEGRLYAYTVQESGKELHILEYVLSFSTVEDGDPMASRSAEARIVISGRNEAGLRLEIRGDGWLGYDENGQIEGRFDLPPVILTDDPEPDEGNEDDGGLDLANVVALHSGPVLTFPMPKQFEQATLKALPGNMDPEAE